MVNKIFKVIIWFIVTVIMIIACLFIVPYVHGANSYPDYTNYVNDYVGILSQKEVDLLNSQLLKYDQETTNQIAVAIVDNTGNEDLEEYSIHLADKWKPGQKGKDNGVIVLVVMNPHGLRIEVGRGLEGEITDIQAKGIEEDIMVPKLRNAEYDAAIDGGVNAIIAAINTSNSPAAAQEGTSTGTIIFVIVAVIFGIIIIAVLSSDSSSGSSYRSGDILDSIGAPIIISDFGGDSDEDSDSDDDDSQDTPSSPSSPGGFSGFGGGSFSGGGASSSW